MNSGNTRYLLCVPCAGFNDILMSIERALIHCRKYKRDLVIDTYCEHVPASIHHHKPTLYDHFDNYVCLECDGVRVHGRLTSELLNILNEGTVYPNQLQGKLTKYQIQYCHVGEHKGKYLSQDKTPIVLTTDLLRDYNEDCVVYVACRGGCPEYILNNIALQDDVRDHVLNKVAQMPGPYTAIHVRNTDWSTDYRTFFSQVVTEIKHLNLLICTDDYRCFDFARQTFGRHNVFAFSEPNRSDVPRHIDVRTLPRTKNLEMFADLFGLAMADQLLYSTLPGQKKSGFTRLAETLHNNKTLLDTILGIPYISCNTRTNIK